MDIQSRYLAVVEQIPESVQLVAVSKTYENQSIKEVYDLGQRDFGENRVQELVQKYESLPKDIRWHQIGHLQTNKVKMILPFVYLIQSVDRPKLIQKIQSEATLIEQKVKVLLQVKIAKEETKSGLSELELDKILKEYAESVYPNIEIKGLMGMASLTEEVGEIEDEFSKLKEIYKSYQEQFKFDTLSMGMSGDFQTAMRHGSTMVRVGSLIFGKRL